MPLIYLMADSNFTFIIGSSHSTRQMPETIVTGKTMIKLLKDWFIEISLKNCVFRFIILNHPKYNTEGVKEMKAFRADIISCSITVILLTILSSYDTNPEKGYFVSNFR